MEILKKDKTAKKEEAPKVVDLTRYTPLNGRLLIRQNPAPHFTSKGVAIPDTQQVKPNTGEVLKMADKIEEDITVGDKLLFRNGGGFPLTIQGEEFLLIHEAEAFLKYTKDDEDPNK